MNKYTTIQIKKETRDELQKYCKKHGHKMSTLVEILIKEKIKPMLLQGVLKVTPNITKNRSY